MSNLLNKLRETKVEAAKRIGAVALAGAIVVGATAGCTNTTNAPNNPNTQNNPNVSATTPSTPNNNGATNEENNAGCSKLLTSVTNDEYYKEILSKTSVSRYNTPVFDSHPFAFLEGEGIDVDKILDGTYKANTMSFVYDDEPNNLYINTRVLIDDSYYQSYLLTYNLSDKEMSDYKMVHGDSTDNSYAWQAFFMNDKISETKQPTQVLESKYSIKTHETFNEYALSYTNGMKDYAIPYIDASSKTYMYMHYNCHFNPSAAVETKSISTATFKYSRLSETNQIAQIHENFNYAQRLEIATKRATTFDLQKANIFKSSELIYTQD